MAPVEDMTHLDFDRSNKGASKQRRDQINAEIATMRDLLPLPESSRQRLSQLQIMSLTCVYVRKCNILQKLFRPKTPEKLPESTDFFQALSGFVLVTTREGKLLYISENVTDYLGHSMVDMKTQGDSLYDIVDKRDHSTVQAQLLQATPTSPRPGHHATAGPDPDKVDPSRDVSFFCRMNMSRTLKRQSGFGDVKVMHVRGHFITVRSCESEGLAETSCVFMATCSPLITPDLKETLVQSNTMVFKTVHKLDMSFIEITKNAEHHLGCSSEDLTNKSWYTVLHPEDIHQAKEKHMQLIHSNHEMGCMVTVRMLRADGSSFWVNSVMQVRQSNLAQSDDAFIVCINQIIDENEAYQIKMQAHMFSVYPHRAHELWGNHLSAISSGPSNHDHLQPGHMAPGMRWIQQDGTTPVPMPGYHNNMGSSSVGGMQSYQPQGVSGSHMMLPYQQSVGHQPAIMAGRQGHPTSAHFSHTQTLVQTDQLKAMLKRKIKGPQQQQPDCKPLKIPKLENQDLQQNKKQEMNGFLDKGMIPRYFHQQGQYHAPSSFQFVPQSSQNVQVMQVMQPQAYTLGTKSTAAFGLKGSMSGFDKKDSTMAMMGLEQVVPDVNVPESFLTPEPSPISSPQPSTSIKMEDQAALVKKGSVSILQALEKLAAMPDPTHTQKLTLHDAKLSTLSKPCAQVAGGQRKRELPIFDAFDIDNFFDALDSPADVSKESLKMEDVQVKREINREDQGSHVGARDPVTIKCEALSPPGSVCSMSPVHQASASHNYTHKQHIQTKDEFLLASSCMKVSARYGTAKANIPNACVVSEMETSSQLSPVSAPSRSPTFCHRQESLEDLLSYFSDEGATISPPHHMTHQSTASPSDDLLDDDYFQQNPHHYKRSPIGISPAEISESSPSPPCVEESFCVMKPEQQQSQLKPGQRSPSLYRFPGELSPSSSSSSLAGEDDIREERTTFTFDLALKMLDLPEQNSELLHRGSLQMKDQAIMNIPDELGFILDSLVPVGNSLEIVKHGQ